MKEYALKEETETSAKILKKKEHIINAALIVFSRGVKWRAHGANCRRS
ncbi:hypothetical protein [Psychrobacter sp. JCM 18900]|nr:hypothetical protein [Psychrobacter sp. JCM 18900]